MEAYRKSYPQSQKKIIDDMAFWADKDARYQEVEILNPLTKELEMVRIQKLIEITDKDGIKSQKWVTNQEELEAKILSKEKILKIQNVEQWNANKGNSKIRASRDGSDNTLEKFVISLTEAESVVVAGFDDEKRTEFKRDLIIAMSQDPKGMGTNQVLAIWHENTDNFHVHVTRFIHPISVERKEIGAGEQLTPDDLNKILDPIRQKWGLAINPELEQKVERLQQEIEVADVLAKPKLEAELSQTLDETLTIAPKIKLEVGRETPAETVERIKASEIKTDEMIVKVDAKPQQKREAYIGANPDELFMARMIEEMEKDLKKQQAEIEKKAQMLALSQNAIAAIAQKNELLKQVDELEMGISKAMGDKAVAEQMLAEKIAELEVATQTVADLESQIAVLDQENTQKAMQLDETTKELEGVKSELSMEFERAESAELLAEQEKTKAEQLTKAVGELTVKNGQLEDFSAAKDKIIDDLRNEATALFAEKEKEINNLKTDRDFYKNAYGSVMDELSALRAEIESLKKSKEVAPTSKNLETMAVDSKKLTADKSAILSKIMPAETDLTQSVDDVAIAEENNAIETTTEATVEAEAVKIEDKWEIYVEYAEDYESLIAQGMTHDEAVMTIMMDYENGAQLREDNYFVHPNDIKKLEELGYKFDENKNLINPRTPRQQLCYAAGDTLNALSVLREERNAENLDVNSMMQAQKELLTMAEKGEVSKDAIPLIMSVMSNDGLLNPNSSYSVKEKIYISVKIVETLEEIAADRHDKEALKKSILTGEQAVLMADKEAEKIKAEVAKELAQSMALPTGSAKKGLGKGSIEIIPDAIQKASEDLVKAGKKLTKGQLLAAVVQEIYDQHDQHDQDDKRKGQRMGSSFSKKVLSRVKDNDGLVKMVGVLAHEAIKSGSIMIAQAVKRGVVKAFKGKQQDQDLMLEGKNVGSRFMTIISEEIQKKHELEKGRGDKKPHSKEGIE